MTSLVVASALAFNVAAVLSADRASAQTPTYSLRFDVRANMSRTHYTTMRVWLDGVLLGDRSTAYGSNAWHARSFDVTNAVTSGGLNRVYRIEWEWVGGNDGAYVRNVRIERDGAADAWHDQYYPQWFSTASSQVSDAYTASDGLTPYAFPEQRNWEAADGHFFRNDLTFQKERNSHYVAVGTDLPKQEWPWWLRFDLSANVDGRGYTTTARFWMDGTLLGDAGATAASPRRWYDRLLHTNGNFVDGETATVTWQYLAGNDASHLRNMRVIAGDSAGWRDPTRATHYDHYHPQWWDVDGPVAVDGYVNARQLGADGLFYDSGSHVEHEFGLPPAPYRVAPSVGSFAPSDGTFVATATPTLSATFDDPNPGDDGYVEFELYQGGSLVASNAAESHVFVQPGQTSSWQVPPGKLAPGKSYAWRARAFDGTNYSDWTSDPANRVLSVGGVTPVMRQWSANSVTGAADYDFSVTASGLNAGGAIAGPCAGIECSWRVVARHSNGAVQKSMGTLASGTLPPDTASLNEPLSGTYWGEVTEIKTVVEPFPCYGCSQARVRYDSEWIKVSDPYPDGDLALSVNLWEHDPDTGVITYDLTVSAGGASQVRGPCEEKGCQWRIEALHADATTSWLRAEQLPGGTWSFDKVIDGTASANITHLKATLDSMCGVNTEYWCWDPWETYRTGWTFVGEHMRDGQDLVPFEAALGGVLALRPSTFCDPLLAAGGLLPSTDGDTVPDAYTRCQNAIQIFGPKIRKVLFFVGAGAGAKVAYDLLIDEHADEGPTPTHEEEQSPPLPWLPPVDSQHNACNDGKIEITEMRRIHVNDRHRWKAGQGASEFYDRVNWEWLVEPYSRTVAPVPSTKSPVTACQRVVTFPRYVGIDRETKQPTRVYTVITDRQTADLITVHPGYPSV